jgi:hypothetical protein
MPGKSRLTFLLEELIQVHLYPVLHPWNSDIDLQIFRYRYHLIACGKLFRLKRPSFRHRTAHDIHHDIRRKLSFLHLCQGQASRSPIPGFGSGWLRREGHLCRGDDEQSSKTTRAKAPLSGKEWPTNACFRVNILKSPLCV